MKVCVPRVKVGSALNISKLSVKIRLSSDQGILKFEVCIVHFFDLSANLNDFSKHCFSWYFGFFCHLGAVDITLNTTYHFFLYFFTFYLFSPFC